MEKENKKIGFFQKLKISIFKLEEYNNFLEQKLSSSFGYFALLILILMMIFSGIYTYEYYKELDTGFSYIKNEMPDFNYEDGILKAENNVEAYDSKYDVKLIINTDEIISEDVLNEYQNKTEMMRIIALKDEIKVLVDNQILQFKYTELQNYLQEMEITNKQSVVDIINSLDLAPMIFAVFLGITIASFLQNLFNLFIYALIIASFGYIASRMAKVKFPIKVLVILAIYSVTLPNILYTAYMIANLLTGFYIEYFSLFYMLISCVYIFTAIFMIKSDIIKQQQEIQAIEKVQEEVNKEAEENLETETNTQEKTKDEKENGKEDEPIIDEDNEPDGSEI